MKSDLIKRFKKMYGEPKTELNYSGAFQLLISVMLSAQSTDKKVNEVTPVLFKAYPNAAKLSKAKLGDVERIIREVNYHKTKARHVIETSRLLGDRFSGEVPKTHEDLISLPGVGNKTANVVMSELGLGFAFPVDTHVFRVSKRLGIADGKTREKVEEQLCEAFPKESWHDLHHYLIFHGRQVCDARKPKCETCKINDICLKAI